MNKYIILIFLGISSTKGLTQEILYSSNEELNNDSIRIEIGIFDLANCESKELFVDTTKHLNGYVEWVDIALGPNGILYGVGSDGIYTINLINGSYSKILVIPGPGIRWKKGMTCTSDTVLIFGERDIFSYDINSSILTNHGRVPGSMSIWSNIFWLNNNLVGSLSNRIVRIDLQDPANSQIYCDLPEQGFLSLTEVSVSCDSIAVFGFHISGDIYLVDVTDCSIAYYCTVPHSQSETFEGSSPAFIFKAPEPCKIQIDLDAQDYSLPGINYLDTVYCSLPNKFILSDLNLFSDKPWDSLLVWIEDGPPGVYLDGPSPTFAELTGRQSNKLRYYIASASRFEELSPFLKELLLTGEIPPGVSTLKIGFCGWAKNLTSDTAFAYITLISRTKTAGDNNSIVLCKADPPFDLSSLLSTNATPEGLWVLDDLILGDYFNPKIDKPGELLYIVDDPICANDTANFIIGTFPFQSFELGTEKLICPGDTAILSIDEPGINLIWSDGSSNNTINILEPQIVWVNIIDKFGCVYSDTSEIKYDDDCLIKDLYIPNIFSPDGSGINDTWGINESYGIKSIEISIFDRWGNILFQQKGESVLWDGNSKDGVSMPTGVYSFIVKLITINNNNFLKAGDLTLIR